MKWGKYLGLSLGVSALAGCTTPISSPPVHSVAYYAARIPPPALQPPPPVAPAVSVAPVVGQLHIVVNAVERRLRIYRGDTLLATYPVAIGFKGSAPHRLRGDDRTPLGHFHIGYVSWGTQYGPFMLLTYPDRADAEWGLREGIINKWQYRAIVNAVDSGQTPPQNTPLGGYIGIHGMGPHFSDDQHAKVFPGRWTAGCVALSNYDAQQIAAMVRVGTPVDVVGAVPSYHTQIVNAKDARPAGLQPIADGSGDSLDTLIQHLKTLPSSSLGSSTH